MAFATASSMRLTNAEPPLAKLAPKAQGRSWGQNQSMGRAQDIGARAEADRNRHELGRTQPISLKTHHWHSAGPIKGLPGRASENTTNVQNDAHVGKRYGELRARQFTGPRIITGGGKELVHHDEGTVHWRRPPEEKPWRHLTPQEQHACIAKNLIKGGPSSPPPAPATKAYRIPSPGSWARPREEPESWEIVDENELRQLRGNQDDVEEYNEARRQEAAAQRHARFAGSTTPESDYTRKWKKPIRDPDGTMRTSDGRVIPHTQPGHRAPPDKSMRQLNSESSVVLGYDRRGSFYGSPREEQLTGSQDLTLQAEGGDTRAIVRKSSVVLGYHDEKDQSSTNIGSSRRPPPDGSRRWARPRDDALEATDIRSFNQSSSVALGPIGLGQLTHDSFQCAPQSHEGRQQKGRIQRRDTAN